jgi:hypothetical protein
VHAIQPLHTRLDFRERLLDHPFDASTLSEIRRVVASLRPTELEMHEARMFGRFVVHNHPFFVELQGRTIALVSETVGEPVEAAYNFLSLYTRSGVCSVRIRRVLNFIADDLRDSDSTRIFRPVPIDWHIHQRGRNKQVTRPSLSRADSSPVQPSHKAY